MSATFSRHWRLKSKAGRGGAIFFKSAHVGQTCAVCCILSLPGEGRGRGESSVGAGKKESEQNRIE